ncbi:MAG: class I SAM-dependent methyltransferase [Caldisphaera sp.]|nr:MAG: class I SAM-dependent methyltransferase [Caldisphaera sp.]
MSNFDLYSNKNTNYFSNARHDIINLVPEGSNKVLEIGCGDGTTLVELKKLGKAKYCAGVDIIDINQKNKLDDFVLADIDNEELPLPQRYFDVIICADILEHLKDPWSTLDKLKTYLKKDGILIASLPNVREIKTIFNIVFKGDFKYVEEGILDKTHLRFFCKKNMIDLFEKRGFVIQKMTHNLDPKSKRYMLNKLTFGIIEEFLVIQYLIIAKVSNGSP